MDRLRSKRWLRAKGDLLLGRHDVSSSFSAAANQVKDCNDRDPRSGADFRLNRKEMAQLLHARVYQLGRHFRQTKELVPIEDRLFAGAELSEETDPQDVSAVKGPANRRLTPFLVLRDRTARRHFRFWSSCAVRQFNGELIGASPE